MKGRCRREENRRGEEGGKGDETREGEEMILWRWQEREGAGKGVEEEDVENLKTLCICRCGVWRNYLERGVKRGE